MCNDEALDLLQIVLCCSQARFVRQHAQRAAMASCTVIPTTPLRQSTTVSYDSSTSSADDDAGDSGFSWTSSSDAGCSFSTSPATSAFSSSPSSSRSLYNGKPSYGRRRASTSASNTLESFARLNTLQEQEAEGLLAEAEAYLHSAPNTAGPAAQSVPVGLLQSPLTLSQIEIRPHTDEPLVSPATPPTPAEIHDAVAAEREPSVQAFLHNHPPDTTDVLNEAPDAAPLRPPLKTKLSKKLFLKGRERASSLSKISFSRPRLERRGATEEASAPAQPDDSVPSTPNGVTHRRRAISRLQERFARSAPSSPPRTPSESTDRVHLFRSRPSSIVLSGRGVEFNYFTGPLSQTPLSQPSSCNASVYQPAMDRIGNWASSDDLVASSTYEIYQDALPQNLFDSLLPREVRLKIFSLVVQTSVEEGTRSMQSRAWTASRAAEDRWIGERAGLRELVKMSRVCREWRDLVFDGQLWQNIHIAKTIGCNTFSAPGLVRLASHAGSFLRRLDLRGFSQLQDADLEDIVESCISHSGVTSLTYIDLSGKFHLPQAS